MSSKKRKTIVYSLIYLHSINAITLIILNTVTSSAYAENENYSVYKSANDNFNFQQDLPVPNLFENNNFNKIIDTGLRTFNSNNDDKSTIPPTIPSSARSNHNNNVDNAPKMLSETEDTKLFTDNRNQFSTKNFEKMILKYVDETLNRRTYEILAGIKIEMDSNKYKKLNQSRQFNGDTARSTTDDLLTFDEQIVERLRQFANTHVIRLNIPRALQSTGRALFFKSIK